MIIGIEMVLVLGVVLGLAVWELVRLRRDRAKEREVKPQPGETETATPDTH